MNLETVAREWLRRPVASHGPPDQKALPTLAEEREFMVQSLLTMLRSIAEQVRREALEEAAKAVQDCPEIFFYERGPSDPLGNRHCTRADLTAAISALATEDKGGKGK